MQLQVHLPSWANPAEASKAIVSAVSKYGRIVDRRLYFDMAEQTTNRGGGGYHWSALDSSGFDLVNTPRRNQKETLNKKMIADVLTFAWDSAVRNDHCKPCIVLLTSDGDYAYTLSKLRDRGVMSVVMYGADSSVASVLKAPADVPLSFEGDVLSTIRKNNKATPSGSVPRGNELATNDTPSLDLCNIAVQQLSKDISEGYGDGWLLGSKLGVSFRAAFYKGDNSDTAAKEAFKEKYRQARELAIKQGWLERGRKRMVGPDQGTIIVTSNEGKFKNSKEKLSLEDFLRVTVQGKRMLGGKVSAAESTVSGSKTRLFIKNLPSITRIQELVAYLESEHNVEVMRGNTIRGAPNTSYIFGIVKLTTEQDAERLLQMSEASKLRYFGRILELSYDRSRSTASVDPEHTYERPTGSTKQGDDIFTFCKALYNFTEQQENEGRPHGWTDGGFFNIGVGVKKFTR
jgi:hypothetical protein